MRTEERNHYERKAVRKIFQEYRRYRRKMLSLSGEEIWECARKIHFYGCVREYFAYREEIPLEYLMMTGHLRNR